MQRDDVNKVFYICTKKSFKPQIEQLTISGLKNKLEIVEIEGTLDFKYAVENILMNNKIDYFIHSMAVSDYIVESVTTPDMLQKSFSDNGGTKESIVFNEYVLDRNSKISSDEDDLIIHLKKAPKIINIIKKISPYTKLIGFKLLNNVTADELFNAAVKLRDVNNCYYVIANDIVNISEEKHIAYVLDKNNNFNEVNGKKNISKYIDKNIII